MNTAADAMGVTVSRLEEMVQSGLAANEFMPKFAKELRKNVRENDALAAAMKKVEAAQTRMSNSFAELADAMFKAGVADIMKGLFSGIADVVDGVTLAFNGLAAVVRPIVDGLESIIESILGAENSFSLLAVIIKGVAVYMATSFVRSMYGAYMATKIHTTQVTRLGAALIFAKNAARGLRAALGIGVALEVAGLAFDYFGGGDKNKSAAAPASSNNTLQLSVDVTGSNQSMGEEIGTQIAQELQAGNNGMLS